jgi:predicted acyl esterase
MILIRTPYARTGLDVLARLFAERGHPVFVQNCRGTFGSTGSFRPLVDEPDDGEDTLHGLSAEPWADRPLALVGASYLGYTAYNLLRTGADRFVGVGMAVTTADFHSGVLYPHGRFSAETALTWIGGLLTQELPALARRRAERRIARRMREALLTTPDRADAVLLDSPYPPYQDWVAHDTMDDPWWKRIDRRPQLVDMPPSVLVAGWFDPFLLGQLADHQALVRTARRTRLVVGPWTHGSPGIVGSLVRETLGVLDRLPGSGGVSVHDGGTGTWVELERWPPTGRTLELFLTGDRRLHDRPGAALECRWTVDPADPPPSAGGRGLNPAHAGRKRQTARERHPGITAATSGSLGRPVTVAGSASVRLTVGASTEAQEWFVRLCDVDRYGISRNVADGYLCMPGSAAGVGEEAVTIDLSPTAYTFHAGHRLRLQVSGSGYPLHPAPSGGSRVRRVMSRQGALSSILLPIVPGGWAAAGSVSRGVS